MRHVESELPRGFKRPLSATESVNNMHRTLTAGAFTFSGDKDMQKNFSSSGVLTNAHHGASGSVTPGFSAPGTPAPSTPAGFKPGGKGMKMSPTDVRMVRGETAHNLKSSFDKKVISVVISWKRATSNITI